MKKFFRLLVILVIVVLVIVAAKWTYDKFAAPAPVHSFRTEIVERTNLQSYISASGTVEPEELVNVGAQVSGKIMDFGLDADGKTVDYGSRVTAGMVLANIDKVLYEAELREAQATKLQAQTSILSAEANLKQAKAQEALCKLNWDRSQELYPKGAVSKSTYDTSEADYLTALADIAVAEAGIEQAKAQLAIAEASLVRAERNLSYCVITSPVDGVIIDRRVSVGQTLVSNMSASTIFLIAKDLKKMQVWVSVNEADIGSIYTGMPVSFSVDAFPGEEFSGVVHKIRLNATMSQNVVTYVVEVETDNSSGRLLPYLTADVKFIREQRENALSVSNSALRYSPDASLIDPEYRDAVADGDRRLWVISPESGLLRPVSVKTGLVTGSMTEIVSGDIREGDVVVNGINISEQIVQAAGGNPFMPTPQRRQPQSRARQAMREQNAAVDAADENKSAEAGDTAVAGKADSGNEAAGAGK